MGESAGITTVTITAQHLLAKNNIPYVSGVIAVAGIG